MAKFLKKENIMAYIIIVLISMMVCAPLCNSKLDITYDDGIQHICRLMGTKQSIQEGQTFPVIMSEFCNGFGYSWNLFYSPLTAFAPLLLQWFGMSFSACLKLFIFAITILTGIAMYYLVKEVTKQDLIAIVAAVIYILAPYRLTDMYIRYALAELVSFLFLPLIFLGLYRILYSHKKQDYWLAIGTIGMILTHTIITLYTAIVCFIYLIIHYKKVRKKKIQKAIILNLLVVIVITAFFWIPLLEVKNSAEYEVFKPGRMERTEVLIAYKLNITQLLYTTPDSGMIYEIGFVTLVGLLLTPMAIKKVKKSHKNTAMWYKTYLFMLIGGLICIFMTLKIFPFEHLPSILKMLQFSFRLLEFSSFFFAIIAAINYGVLIQDFGMKEVMVLASVNMILTVFLFSHLQYREQAFDESVLWPAVSVTSQTGRVHAGCASFEYLPSKAFENRDYIETRDQSVQVLDGSCQIEDEEKEHTNLSLKVAYVLTETKIELPYIYYPGYTVQMEVDGKKQTLQTYETDKGFVGVILPITEHGNVTLHYTGTVWMKVSGLISLIGVCVFLGLHVRRSFKKKSINRIQDK